MMVDLLGSSYYHGAAPIIQTGLVSTSSSFGADEYGPATSAGIDEWKAAKRSGTTAQFLEQVKSMGMGMYEKLLDRILGQANATGDQTTANEISALKSSMKTTNTLIMVGGGLLAVMVIFSAMQGRRRRA